MNKIINKKTKRKQKKSNVKSKDGVIGSGKKLKRSGTHPYIGLHAENILEEYFRHAASISI